MDKEANNSKGQLHDFAVFFILSEERIKQGKYATKQKWQSAQDELKESKRNRQSMAILFGDAVNDSDHIFRWALLRGIAVSDNGTSVTWDTESVREVPDQDRRFAEELWKHSDRKRKRSDRKRINRRMLRGHAVVETPNWLQQIHAGPTISTSNNDQIIEVPDDPLELERQLRNVRQRLYQTKFRRALLEAYEERCAISDCGVKEVLEAAHVDLYSETGDNSIENGLLLRTDLHVLFDQGLLLIEPDFHKIRIAKDLRGTMYKDLEGKELRARKSEPKWPRHEALVRRWKK